jgi:D-glycero-D-manno-heptose 1,7-bisphosphate phosphatase
VLPRAPGRNPERRLKSAVFLDRDGVLNDVVVRDGEPGSPRSLEQFRSAPDLPAILRLGDAGLLVFIITNQPDVARGLVTSSVQLAMLERIRSVVPVDDFRICMHDDSQQCDCRKPKPGMILDLAQFWHADLRRSFVVGDTWRDVAAARAAGCRSILIRNTYNDGVVADAYADTLTAAVELVLEQHGG